MNFITPTSPVILVKKLSEEIVRKTKTIEAHAKNDGYWLKLCQYGFYSDISVLEKIETERFKQF